MASRRDTYIKQVQELSLPLSGLRGVGPKRAALLTAKGIHNVLDLLFFIPVRYEDRTRITPLDNLTEDGEPALVRGRVIGGGEERLFPSRKRVFRILLKDRNDLLELLWFHYRKPHLQGLAEKDRYILAYGRIGLNRGRRQMIHPDVTLMEEGDPGADLEGPGIFPVYSQVPGLSPNILRKITDAALDTSLADLIDPLPPDLAGGLGLPDLGRALGFVHRPDREASLDDLNNFRTPCHQRLDFDRVFLIMLAVAFRKRSREKRSGPRITAHPGLMDDLRAFFPFPLTGHQERCLEEISADLASERPMNRLLLGDVGCGKTLVAAVAAYLTVRSRRQVAMMVPTQVLAGQHMAYFSGLPGEMGFRPVLLTGAMNGAGKKGIYAGIERGDFNLVIGTQALIQEGLSFPGLGLVIIDEQQRFGVRERSLMDRKGLNPNLLVMTATPIPRTLAMTLCGDLDVSLIREFPAGRRPVDTRLVLPEDKRLVFDTVRERMSRGEQCFVVCPVIEGSEEDDLKDAVTMAERLKKVFGPEFRVGMVHGRMPPGEKEGVMGKFREGRIDLIVGTTVVEVGIHVPGATVMVIEHPERFGLAQLHQLRGRVGRGDTGGVCFLMGSHGLPERSRERLRVLVDNHDGFRIAEKDLEMRGRGELIGMRQAGMGELDFSSLLLDEDLLIRAGDAARQLIEGDPDLSLPENAALRAFVEGVLAGPLDPS